MSESKPEDHNEIIIVRRSRDNEHGEHHGGVWKIAYADFMTAMMAFFLVMWLINAANEETKAIIANYFNPIKLVDSKKEIRGLQDKESPQIDGDKQNGGASPEKESKTQNAQQSESQNSSISSSADQAKMMNMPYETLDQIAEVQEGTGSRLDGQGGVQHGGSRLGANDGNAYQDPFSPEYWSANVSPENLTLADEANVKTGENAGHALQIQAMLEAGNGQPVPGKDDYLPVGGKQNGIATQQNPELNPNVNNFGGEKAGGMQNTQQPQATPAQATPAEATTQQVMAQEPKTTSEQNVQNATNAANDGNVVANIDSTNKGQDDKAATGNALPREVDDISSKLAELLEKQPGGLQPLVNVVPSNDGVAIELMDKTNYGMFSIGSSKPDKQTVELLAGIARILAGREGDVIISGHTDARPYRSATYDNWQLSSARAQMAYYMLVRGGLDEKRILRVEGYADRDLKNSKDPYAAENRRIEIFLRNPPKAQNAGNNLSTGNGNVAPTNTRQQANPNNATPPATTATPTGQQL